jgi:4-azaleucine resistance transporter AzlC
MTVTNVATASQPKQKTLTRQQEFVNGIKGTIPMMIGAAPFGIIFGVIGIDNGLSPFGVMGLSLFVFAGSAQFVAAGLVGQGVGILFIILTTFILNLRHALYAASLAPYMRHLSQKWLLPLAFWLTDETYAVVIQRYPQEDNSLYKHWYHFGSSLAMYINWQLCTLVGIIAGTQLQGLSELGLDFAMVVTFLGIVVPMLVSRPMLLCAVVAGVVSVLTFEMPNKIGLMLAAVAGIVAGVIAEAWMPAKPKVQPNP